MKRLAVLFALIGSPAFAASGPFFSLFNTDFVVLISFLVFIGVLVYFKVPGILMGLLDQRAEQIRNELDEARALREEAQTILASYERKQREVAEQSERIVAHAREEAQIAAEQAKADLKASIARRLAAAEDQIASAENSAVREVRDRAISIAVAAAAEVIAARTSAADQNKLIEGAIEEVSARLH
ncbi:F0F1 ATP synthase subunit B [Nioella sp.]|uniref:F0F1 ATP synthase subunit B n=1 Tax=Nioella sp. TaxID=1912091 RepID=UPI003A862FF3